MAYSPYNKRGRVLLRGIIIIRRVIQALINKRKRDKGEKKKESLILTKV